MSLKEKIANTIVAVGLIGSLGGFGTYMAERYTAPKYPEKHIALQEEGVQTYRKIEDLNEELDLEAAELGKRLIFDVKGTTGLDFILKNFAPATMLQEVNENSIKYLRNVREDLDNIIEEYEKRYAPISTELNEVRSDLQGYGQNNVFGFARDHPLTKTETYGQLLGGISVSLLMVGFLWRREIKKKKQADENA